jgi:hypothetical protein
LGAGSNRLPKPRALGARVARSASNTRNEGTPWRQSEPGAGRPAPSSDLRGGHRGRSRTTLSRRVSWRVCRVTVFSRCFTFFRGLAHLPLPKEFDGETPPTWTQAGLSRQARPCKREPLPLKRLNHNQTKGRCLWVWGGRKHPGGDPPSPGLAIAGCGGPTMDEGSADRRTHASETASGLAGRAWERRGK